MSHPTEQSPPLSPNPLVKGGRYATLVDACVRGGAAAALGLGALAVVVTAAWITSPYPDGSPGGALHLAAGLWLLAHGVDLVRTDTLSGVPAPLGVAPMLLMVLPGWLAHRAARDAFDAEEGRPKLTAAGAVGAVTGGYLLVAAGVVASSASGPLPADPLAAALWLPVVVTASAGLGVWTACGRPLPEQEHAAVALRSAALAAGTLLVGGALLVAVSLAWHAGAAHTSFARLAGDWSGRASVVLLALALVPNASVWAASYALGPGVALGPGIWATPLGLSGGAAVPPFPLLAALPTEGPGAWPQWAAAVIAPAAALLLGWRVGRSARWWAAREAALTALAASWACGAVLALLAALAGGPLGTGRLSAFGPVWWQTGAAAVLWCAVVAVPTTLGVRAWARRDRSPAADGASAPVGAGGAPLGPAAVPEADRVVDPEPLLDDEDESAFESYGFLPAAWEPTPLPGPTSPAPSPDPSAPQAPSAPPAPSSSDPLPGPGGEPSAQTPPDSVG
ncbi:DUF6350 family protein [Streptomyces sp. NBC_01216]|uniref:cell division protein PerM n=1 Tax=unclassified Streptomyces TaxID=2593676 RepID=UPI002E0E2E06|nr:DUF6350 family protein [Streptomyces sp. NBC_01216]